MSVINVSITEMLKKTIRVDAATKEEAITKVEGMWESSNESCVLTADDFVYVEFFSARVFFDNATLPKGFTRVDDAYVEALRNEENEVMA